MRATEIILRLLLAAGLGAIIGLERELHRKPAGLRTNMLIALGAAIFTMMSIRLGHGMNDDRIAAQIVTGVGFLGAGAIVRDRGGIHGLTTAATIWVNAAIGTAAGAGEYLMASVSAAVTLVVLAVLAPVESRFDRYRDRP